MLRAAFGELRARGVFLEVSKKCQRAVPESPRKHFHVKPERGNWQDTEHIDARPAPELIPDFPRVTFAA